MHLNKSCSSRHCFRCALGPLSHYYFYLGSCLRLGWQHFRIGALLPPPKSQVERVEATPWEPAKSIRMVIPLWCVVEQTVATPRRNAHLVGQSKVMLWILLFLVDNIKVYCGVMVHNKKDIMELNEKTFDFAIVSRFGRAWPCVPL